MSADCTLDLRQIIGSNIRIARCLCGSWASCFDCSTLKAPTVFVETSAELGLLTQLFRRTSYSTNHHATSDDSYRHHAAVADGRHGNAVIPATSWSSICFVDGRQTSGAPDGLAAAAERVPSTGPYHVGVKQETTQLALSGPRRQQQCLAP